ncbi:MAG: histidine phosphotransferase family protein [Caulobacteraceae bacterium]
MPNAAENLALPPAEAASAIDPAQIASRLAARLCHDFLSPASGIVSGLDLIEDPASKDFHGEAMALISASARKLVGLLTFSRAAFAAGVETIDTRELESLARGAIVNGRTELDWAVQAGELAPMAGRALLNLLQIAAGALASGGVVRVSARREGGWSAVLVESRGPRARLHEEVRAGLRGEGPGESVGGRWIQAWWLHALVTGAGGALAAEAGDEGVTFRAAVRD